MDQKTSKKYKEIVKWVSKNRFKHKKTKLEDGSRTGSIYIHLGKGKKIRISDHKSKSNSGVEDWVLEIIYTDKTSLKDIQKQVGKIVGNRSEDKKKEFLTRSVVIAGVKSTVKSLNTRFKTSDFSVEESKENIKVLFKTFGVFELELNKDDYPFGIYNKKTVYSNIMDKVQSLMYNKEVPYFQVTEKGQKIVFLGGDLIGNKGVIIDPCIGEDYAKVWFVDRVFEINKNILGVIG